MLRTVQRFQQNLAKAPLSYKTCLNNGPAFKVSRLFHRVSARYAKIFIDKENAHAFSIVENGIIINSNKFIVKNEQKTITTEEDFNEITSRNWRKGTATEIVVAFKSLLPYCVLHNINVSEHKFDNLTDGLMDHVEKLTFEEISELLDTLREYPACGSYKSHNFHDIWSALDDICCFRINEMDRKQMFEFADKWFKVNLGKVSDFIYQVLDKLSRHPDKLSTEELVHAYFLINVCRKRAIDFQFESALEEKIKEMSLDQMAVVALGHFKSQTKIKSQDILISMMRKIKESQEFSEISACAILKVVRYSAHPSLAEELVVLLDYIMPKLNSMSTLGLLHTALLGTTLQVSHKASVTLAAQRIAENAHNVEEIRLKDMERILLPLTMIDYDPNTKPDIYEAVYDELHKPARLAEIIKHPRCLASALLFLSVREIYSHELTNKVLDPEFIIETYGKSSKMIPREIFVLDRSVNIECPDYKGNRLEQKKMHTVAKWQTVFTPSRDQYKKLSKADEVVLDVIDTVETVCGGQKHMNIAFVLPHFSRSDIVLCKDKKTNKFVEPFGFEKYILGDILHPTDLDNFTWYAVVTLGWNNTLRSSSIPVGQMNMKMRQLSKIGYKPVPVIWNQYMPLSISNKMKYVIDRM